MAEDFRQPGRGQRADEVAEGKPRLQHAQRIATMAFRCVLGNEHPCARHLPADRSPLQDPQRQQHQRRPIADVRVRRHDADEQAGQRHHQNAEAEDTFAAQLVGKVRHQNAAQRARQVARDEDPEALQQAQPLGHFRRKEQLTERQGEKYENDEVVDFQRPAQRRQAQGFVVSPADRLWAWSKNGCHERPQITG